MQTIAYFNPGQMDYREAWDFQTSLHKSLIDNKLAHRHLPPKSYGQNHALVLCEHPPVFTLGKTGSPENLLLDEAELAAKGIQYFPINRGGDITFHGPGQIVGYPILDLECFFTDVHKYVRCIEEVIIRTLAEYGVAGFRIKDFTGVWVEGQPAGGAKSQVDAEKKRKICAIGVHMSRWVTLHGWAFNVATDLKYFDYIIPCGIAEEDKTVTSLEHELGDWVRPDEVRAHILRHFSDIFECQIEPVPFHENDAFH